jgi:myo-inositol 2-dehydrogenase/D-chiro-inositol 1-dehydrogenase
VAEAIGIGIVGAGRQGRAQIAAALDCPAVALRVVCDPVPGLAAAAAPDGLDAETELAAALSRPDVVAIVIAAPTGAHEAIVEQTLRAGRHVLCEKPLTFDAAADARLAALAHEQGLVLHVGFYRRHAWPYSAARALIRDGAIGEPRFVRAAQWDAEPPSPAFLATSGGIEIDCGVHEFDIAMWLLDAPFVEVTAIGAPTRPEIAAVDDVEAAVLLARTAAGHPVIVDLHRACAFHDTVRTEVVGSAGALIMTCDGDGSLEVGDAAGLRSIAGPAGDVVRGALVAQLTAFAEAIGGGGDGGSAAPADASLALAAAQAAQASRRAATTVRLR